MVDFNITVKLLDSNKSLEAKVLKDIRLFLKDGVLPPQGLRELTVEVRQLVAESIRNQPEYRSLLGGKLQGELGVPNSSSRLISIVEQFINALEVKLTKPKVVFRSLVGSIIIQLDGSFSNILSNPSASYITDKGQTIPWLRWLLLEGDLTISSYVFRITPAHVVNRYSRTGLGLMFPKRGGRWTVPPEFAGTQENNFITRAITQIEQRLLILFEKKVIKFDC